MDQRFHYPGGMSQDVEDVPLLVPEDLPAGWVMPDPPVIESSADSVAIDAALKYDKRRYPTPGPDGELTGYNDGRDGRWFLIEHVQQIHSADFFDFFVPSFFCGTAHSCRWF